MILFLTIILGGVVASWLMCSSPGSSPGWGHSVELLGKTLHSHSALYAQVYKWVPVNLMLEVTLQWTCIPSRGWLVPCHLYCSTQQSVGIPISPCACFLPFLPALYLLYEDNWGRVRSRGGVDILLVASCYRNGISSSLIGHLACVQTIFFFFCLYILVLQVDLVTKITSRASVVVKPES